MFDLREKEVYIVKECAAVWYENGVVTHSCRQEKKKWGEKKKKKKVLWCQPEVFSLITQAVNCIL